MTRPGAVLMAVALCALPVLVQADAADRPILRIEDVRKIANRSEGFTEPSGLALASDGQGYWSVSDDSTGIFRLTAEGRLDPGLGVPLVAMGLEGVVEDTARRRLLVIQEEEAAIIAVELTDGAASLHPLSGMSGFAKIATIFGPLASNNGLEGITVDTSTDQVVVVKESEPRLMIRISADLSTILGVTELTAASGFACDGTEDAVLDVSDITHDATRNAFWLLSDEGACVVLFDPRTGQMTGFALPAAVDRPNRRLKHPEGIALNRDGTALRVVTDDGKDSRLAILSILSPEAAEDVLTNP
jgi:SdiA-regulated